MADTKKTKLTRMEYDDMPIGIEEWKELTADQLREAIARWSGFHVVRLPDGGFNLCEGESIESYVMADVRHLPDGSYEVIKTYEETRSTERKARQAALDAQIDPTNRSCITEGLILQRSFLNE